MASDTMSMAKALFGAGDYDGALLAFQQASQQHPLETEPLAGMALCYFALGKSPHARRIWKIVVSRDERYLLPRFLRTELHWSDEMLAFGAKVSALVV